MKLRPGKMVYKVPLVERIEYVYLNDRKNNLYLTISLVTNSEMERLLKSIVKKAELYSIPAYASYTHTEKEGIISFYPPPDKAYEVKCRYIETKEF